MYGLSASWNWPTGGDREITNQFVGSDEIGLEAILDRAVDDGYSSVPHVERDLGTYRRSASSLSKEGVRRGPGFALDSTRLRSPFAACGNLYRLNQGTFPSVEMKTLQSARLAPATLPGAWRHLNTGWTTRRSAVAPH